MTDNYYEPSLAEIVTCRCPRCGVVFDRRFEYGCADVMPKGGYPPYYCRPCKLWLEYRDVDDELVLNPHANLYRTSKKPTANY